MKYLVYLFLILTSINIQAQNKSDYISEEKIKAFAKNWRWQNSLKYLEVMKDAQKLFVTGKKVNQTLLKQHFSKEAVPLWNEELRNNNLEEYMLFAGGNGIIAQAVVLFVAQDDSIVKIEVLGWGR